MNFNERHKRSHVHLFESTMLRSRTVVRLFSTNFRGRIYPGRCLKTHGYLMGSVRSGLLHTITLMVIFKVRPSTSASRSLNTSVPRATMVKDTSSNGDSPQAKTIPESEKVAMLEATAKAPWLSSLPDNIDDRLKVAYLIVFQLVLYLDRPMELEETTQFFTVSNYQVSFNERKKNIRFRLWEQRRYRPNLT